MKLSPLLLTSLLCMLSNLPAEVATKSKAPAKEEAKQETPRPAAVSTVSIEDISGFEKYPRQVQSLVQSAMALTRLELRYMYGSHDPAKGGMDCSGTVYHVLEFQGLKSVPRQSDEMCGWVEKKSQLHLTPTATTFDHDEFASLKPGDLLFWTNTMETKRKLPVTHVMIYLGKHKKTGKRIVFGASDGRSFQGERRSGVSVFDFSLPRSESSSKFYGYGAAPGLLPEEPQPVVIDATPKPVNATTPAVEKVAPKPATKPAEPKEEVRQAVTIVSEAKPESKTAPATKTTSAKPEAKVEVKKATEADTTAKTTKSKAAAVKKKTTPAATTTKRRTPAPPPKSTFERKVDQAVGSIRRLFRN